MQWMVNVANVWQKIRKPYVNIGGTWTPIKKGFVNVAGTWQQFFSAADYLTLVAGLQSGASGYVQGEFGTMTPTVLGDGKTIIELQTGQPGGFGTPVVCFLAINGFTSDPGVNYIASISWQDITTMGAVSTLLPSQVSTTTLPAYGYSGGQANWSWQGNTNGASFSGIVNQDTSQVIITRN